MNPFAELMIDDDLRDDPQAWIDAYRDNVARTAMGALGIDIVALSDEECAMEVEITDKVRQPMGLLHGGVSLLVAESATSMHSAWLCDLKSAAPVGVDINGTHLYAATEGRVRATARVLRKSRSFLFHEVDVVLMGEDERLLCKARVTNYLRPHGG